MLQYLIILLDETSISFCHYDKPKIGRRLIPIEMLRKGIRFGMMENLMIQFLYPDYELPQDYADVIESIDHSKIKRFLQPFAEEGSADVWVTDVIGNVMSDVPVVWRTCKDKLFVSYDQVIKALENVPRLNIVLTDIETFAEKDFEEYKAFLDRLSAKVEQLYVDGKSPQLNLLTDRMMLAQMNNCGAGDTTITLAPNGRFYVCPAFYYEDEADSIGDIEHGLDIKNKHLYHLDYAPICCHCDAWQCKRCIWLNRKTTLEVNTPSHEQCVLAHIERNSSRKLLTSIRKHGTFLPGEEEIQEIDYLDPFEKRDEWKRTKK